MTARDRLSTAFRRAYEAAGYSQEALSDVTRIRQATISKYARGEVQPPLNFIEQVEDVLGQPRGHILRLAGYVSDEVDVIAAIWSDTTINDVAKGYLVQAYEFAQEVAPAPETPELTVEPTEAELAAVVPDLDDVGGEGKIWAMKNLSAAEKRYEIWLLRGRRAPARPGRRKADRHVEGREAG